jgi:hypothetical protein
VAARLWLALFCLPVRLQYQVLPRQRSVEAVQTAQHAHQDSAARLTVFVARLASFAPSLRGVSPAAGPVETTSVKVLMKRWGNRAESAQLTAVRACQTMA